MAQKSRHKQEAQKPPTPAEDQSPVKPDEVTEIAVYLGEEHGAINLDSDHEQLDFETGLQIGIAISNVKRALEEDRLDDLDRILIYKKASSALVKIAAQLQLSVTFTEPDDVYVWALFTRDPVGIETWITNRAYRPRNLIAFVVRGVKDTLFPEAFNVSLKSLIELHPLRFAGLKTGFKLDYVSATQLRVIPSPCDVDFDVIEKYGRPIDTLLHKWGDVYNSYLIDHEKSIKNPSNKATISEEDVTVDVMFLETDPTHTCVANAFLGKNLRVIYYSGIKSARDVSVLTPERVKTKFTMDGVFSRGSTVDQQAQALLDEVNVQATNKYLERSVFVTAPAANVEKKN